MQVPPVSFLFPKAINLFEVPMVLHGPTVFHYISILYSVGCNANHGLRRTNADKRKAVMKLLEDDEWNQWSNYKISERCAVSEYLVRSLRPKSSSTFKSQIETQDRKVERNGTIYTQNTTNIGKHQIY